MLRVRAGRLVTVTAPPIEDGAVLIGADGRIAAVGPHSRVPSPHEATALEFRDAMLVPGLVNCHTHLELTHLAGRISEPEFVVWIRRIREMKDRSTREGFRAAAEAGLRDCWARGVTCVADTGSSRAVPEVLARLGGRGICYHEVFGPDPGQVDDSMIDLGAALADLRPLAAPGLIIGVSPHAPFTVSESLYRAVGALARREDLPIALHLAESRAEADLVRRGAGPFAEVLRARGIAVTARDESPVAYLARLGVLTPRTLCIHCVQLDGEDVRTIAAHGASVAHCPRSNAAHGHGRAPLAALRGAGIRVGLGTDSVASVHDLDPWAEAAAAGLSGADALRLLTREGARALGLDGAIGALDQGMAGDLAVFPLPSTEQALPSGPALLTAVHGRVVHRA